MYVGTGNPTPVLNGAVRPGDNPWTCSIVALNPDTGTLAWGKERAQGWFKILNDSWLGPNKQYLCGDQITIADYFGVCLVTMGEVIGSQLSAYPNVERWVNNMRKLESWKGINEAHYGFVNAVKDKPFKAL